MPSILSATAFRAPISSGKASGSEKGIQNGIHPTTGMLIYVGEVLSREYAGGAKLVLAAFGHDEPPRLKDAIVAA